MQAENNNDIAITEAKLKDFLRSVLSSEGIVVDIRRTFIEYNGVNRFHQVQLADIETFKWDSKKGKIGF